MVLRRDDHASRSVIDDGGVRTAVAERELEGSLPSRGASNLVSQAHAEHRTPPEQRLQALHPAESAGGIARPGESSTP